MLERILNIGPDIPRKENGKMSSYERYVRKPQISKMFGNDSIIFSPAAIFLSKINWLPKDITILSEEKLFIHFFLGDYEFSTLVDFNVFYKEPEQAINVYKQYIDRNERKKSLIKVIFKKQKISILEDVEKISLRALDTLYERIIDLHIKREMDGHNIYVINRLLESIDKELHKEFDYIFATVLTFIDKLGKFKVINNFEFPATIYDLIKIDRIMTIDA